MLALSISLLVSIPGVPQDCDPYGAPKVRTAQKLTVQDPPRKSEYDFIPRTRSHHEGASRWSDFERAWVGPRVPRFVPLIHRGARLQLLEQEGDLFVAFYQARVKWNAKTAPNKPTYVLGVNSCGKVQFDLSLADFHPRKNHLEVQDIRYVDGILYFNEACQTYSKEAGGKCSYLVALDPLKKKVLWRSKPLVSNFRLLVHGDYIVTGYGFTKEKKRLNILRRRDGKLVFKTRLIAEQAGLRLLDEQHLEVTLHYKNYEKRRFRMVGWKTKRPRLVPASGKAK